MYCPTSTEIFESMLNNMLGIELGVEQLRFKNDRMFGNDADYVMPDELIDTELHDDTKFWKVGASFIYNDKQYGCWLFPIVKTQIVKINGDSLLEMMIPTLKLTPYTRIELDETKMLDQLKKKVDEVIEANPICPDCKGRGWIIDIPIATVEDIGFTEAKKEDCPRCKHGRSNV